MEAVQDVGDGLPDGRGNVWRTMEEVLLRPEGKESVEFLLLVIGFGPLIEMKDRSLRIEETNEGQKVQSFVDDGGAGQEEIVGGSSQQRGDDAMMLRGGIPERMSFIDDDGGPKLKEEGGDSAFDGSLLVHGGVGAVDQVESLVLFVPKVKGVAEGFVRVDGGEEDSMFLIIEPPGVKIGVPREDFTERFPSLDDEEEIRVDVSAPLEFEFECIQDGFWNEEEGGEIILLELFKDAEERGERFSRAHSSADNSKGSSFEFVEDVLLWFAKLDVELPIEGKFWGILRNALLLEGEVDVLLARIPLVFIKGTRRLRRFFFLLFFLFSRRGGRRRRRLVLLGLFGLLL